MFASMLCRKLNCACVVVADGNMRDTHYKATVIAPPSKTIVDMAPGAFFRPSCLRHEA